MPTYERTQLKSFDLNKKTHLLLLFSKFKNRIDSSSNHFGKKSPRKRQNKGGVNKHRLIFRQSMLSGMITKIVQVYRRGCENCLIEVKLNVTSHLHLIDMCKIFHWIWYRFGHQTMTWYVTGANDPD